MSTDKLKSLWGDDFRVVAEGLAETDVVIFVEKLMRQHRESLKQLDHIPSLHELAKKTVQEAETQAASTREEAKRNADAEYTRIIAEAKEKAQEVLQEADRTASDRVEAAGAKIAEMEAGFRKKTQQRMARIDSALRALQESAIRELSTRMRTHYIGKHLFQSVHFIPAFERLIKEVEAEMGQENQNTPSTGDLDPPTQNSHTAES